MDFLGGEKPAIKIRGISPSASGGERGSERIRTEKRGIRNMSGALVGKGREATFSNLRGNF